MPPKVDHKEFYFQNLDESSSLIHLSPVHQSTMGKRSHFPFSALRRANRHSASTAESHLRRRRADYKGQYCHLCKISSYSRAGAVK